MRGTIFLFLLCLVLTSAFAASSIIIGVRELDNGNFQGVIANLTVTIGQGSGHVFIDTMPLTEIDTQTSARLAKSVACESLNVNCSNLNFYYVIRGEFPMIGGPSAGGAMAAITMAELLGKDLVDNIAMTGTINPDGSIGPIGGLLEKALAASDYGITKFLVPAGQINEVINYTFPNGMRVVEVATVIEAYNEFVGLLNTPVTADIDFESFNLVMKPTAEELIGYSERFYLEMNDTIFSRSLNTDEAEAISILVNQTLVQRDESIALYDDANYYSAASYSVGTAVNFLYIKYLVEYFSAADNSSYLSSLFYDSQVAISQVEELLNEPKIVDNVNDIEAINAAIDRLFEAKDLYSEAILYNESSEVFDAMYNLAFVHARLNTAYSWLNLTNYYSGDLNIVFSQDLLKDLALQRLEEADNMITYADSLVYGMPNGAEDELGKAYDAYNEGNYIYSIFESLRAIANANLAIQVSGVSESQVNTRINISRRLARENIVNAQSGQLTPLLAISYYQYSDQFESSSPGQALLFLEYSKQFSKLSTQMVYNIIGPMNDVIIPDAVDVGQGLLTLIIGIGIGAVISILLMIKILRA